MILSICPNPSIDCTIELDSLNVGMLNRVSNKIETYSGKALNVSIGVARLGGESFATGFLFNKHSGLFEQNLTKEKVKFDFVYNEGSARTNYKIIDKKSMLTEINDKGDLVAREKQLELIRIVERLSKLSDIAVMSGSLPKGVNPDFYYEVLSAIPNNVKKVVDTEKENMEFALKCGVYMVKPNLRELEAFTNMEIHSKNDIVKGARLYIEKGAKIVLVSLGAEGAVITDGENSYYCKSANVAVNSTVGAGDSMVSAACIEISKGATLDNILKSSVAAGTASITTSGTNLFYRDKYAEIYQKLKIERI